jgi:hypothetical protein
MNSKTFAITLLIALAMMVRVPAHAGEIHFIPLNDPHQGPVGTAGDDINDLGVAAGFYWGANGVLYGFVSTPPYSNTSFTTVAVAGSPLTHPWGINLEGAITGNSRDTSGVYHGFVSHPPYSTVTTLDAPGACSSGAACAGLGTTAWSINVEGGVAGTYYDVNGVSHGFVSYPPYNETNFTTLDAPGACSSGTACSGLGTGVFAFSLNDLGAVTGYYLDAFSVYHGFVSYPPYTKTTFTTFDAPGACSSDSNPLCAFEGTYPASINLFGVITGTYYDAQGLGHGFVSHPPHTKTTFTSFDATGSIDTVPVSINAEGVVVGSFYDASDVAHGFLSYPPYTSVTTFDAPHACHSDSNPECAFNGTFPGGINTEGVFTGAATDASSDLHGFVGHQ